MPFRVNATSGARASDKIAPAGSVEAMSRDSRKEYLKLKIVTANLPEL
jgi:hypothetical protein